MTDHRTSASEPRCAAMRVLLVLGLIVAAGSVALPCSAQDDGLRLAEPGTAAETDTAPGLDVGSLRLGEPSGGEPIEVELDETLDEALEAEFGDEPEFGQVLEAPDDQVEDATEEIAEHIAGTDDAGEHAEGEHGAGAHGDGHHEAFDPVEFGATLLNFVIWLAIIIVLMRKPLTNHLVERRRAVEEGLVEAARLEREAQTKHAEYSERLSHLDEELEKLRGEMVQAGEAEADRIIAEAEERAARMRRDAEFRIAQQMKQLRSDLTQEAIEAAVSAAEQVLEKGIGAPDHERLANEYLEQLSASMEEEIRA